VHIFKLSSVVLLLLLSCTSYAQRYLQLDKYSPKNRVKLYKGDEIWYSVLHQKERFRAKITTLTDTSIIINTGQEIPLTAFDRFYFEREGITTLRAGTLLLGGGFMLAAATHPLYENPLYLQEDSLVLGTGFLLLNQALKLFRIKAFKVNNRTRLRVVQLPLQ
jgi:hypothetical protein